MAHVEFKWRSRAPGPGLTPQGVGIRLTEIERRDGQISPEAVVEDARPIESPLHNGFEWDDDAAAEAWRIHQARKLIASVVVKTIEGKKVAGTVRAFVNLGPTDEEPRQYLSIVSVMSDEEKRGRLLEQALAELEYWKTRYEHLVEFGPIFDAAAEVARSHRGKKRKVARAESRPSA